MKFHKERTAIRSPLEGLSAYESAFTSGELRKVTLTPTAERRAPSGSWRVLNLVDVRFKEEESIEPLEISGMTIPPRALVVDELTRHRSTRQVFVPVTGSYLAVAAESLSDDPEHPDPSTLVMVSVSPGEAFEVGVGTWHTLPYSFGDVGGLSIMHRESLDSYHDVRDLAAEGWVAVLGFVDPDLR